MIKFVTRFHARLLSWVSTTKRAELSISRGSEGVVFQPNPSGWFGQLAKRINYGKSIFDWPVTHIEWHTPRSSSNYRKMRACCKILVASAKHHYMESMACCPACCTCAHSGKTAVALPICGPLSAKRTDSRRRMWKTKAHGSQRSTNLWAGDTRLKIESEWPLQKHRHRHRNRNRNRKATGYWELGTATPIDFRVKTRWGLLLSLLPWRLRVSNGFLPAFCHMVRKK